MTTLTIGRFSMSDGPSAIRHDGDNLDLDLQIDGATTSDPVVAKVLRQQLLGLANNADEPVVPLTFSDDSDLDGFYVVEGVSCEPFEMFLNNGTMDASVSLRRLVGGYAAPQIELLTGAYTRTNFDSVTGAPVVSITTGSERSAEGSGAFGLDIRSATVNVTAISTLGSTASHYNGACAVEVQIGGSWYPVVGRQLPGASPTWRITNKHIRFTPGTNGVIEVYNGSAWEACNNLRWASSSNSPDATFSAVSPIVIRNSPECVVVRTFGALGDADFLIKRGNSHIEISTRTGPVGVAFASSTACTAVGANHLIHQTANDANGNRVVLGALGTLVGLHSQSTATGGIRVTSGAAQLMVGVNFDGTGASANNTPTQIRNQWLGIAPLKQRVVAR